MLIDYQILEKEVIEILENNKNWVLSTSFIDKITSRTMSIINIGMEIYFQTNKKYTKYTQMIKNSNVSLCYNNISIEAVVQETGSWEDEKNKNIMELYKKSHLSSYNKYGGLDGQVVFKVVPKRISLWKYSDIDPYREILYIDKKMAERIEY